jgi:acetolactate synthase-1/2/3 large subunit
MAASPLLTEDVRPGEAIVRVLEEAGVDAVFGMVGGETFRLFDALYDHAGTVRTVAVREESLAGVMAEVYGRLTGRPGVVIGQGAFVVSNALLGTLEAHLSSSPMLLLTDATDGGALSQHAPYQGGGGRYGNWDAEGALRAVTKEVMTAREGAEAVHAVQLACKHALSGEPGPVGVLLFGSALRGRVGPASRPRLYSTRPYLPGPGRGASPEEVSRVAERLVSAARPVILAGNGVRLARAFAPLERLAVALGAPVATSSGGKGVFPEIHELAVGVCGTYGLPLANAVLARADVVLVLGAKLSPTDTANESLELLDPERQTLIQVDVEPRNAAWSYPVDEALIGDAGVVIEQLAAAIELDPAVVAARGADLAAQRDEHGWFDVEASFSDALPLGPRAVVDELARGLGDDAFVTCDAGENRLFMLRHFQTRSAGAYLQPAGVGGMGYAVPAALAARLVFPERHVVAVCGDGGFSMAMNGLMTAREERLPITVVVLNNSALGWVYHGQGERRIGSEFEDFDYAAIARAMGCVGVNASTREELAAALAGARTSELPTVIDVTTGKHESFQSLTSPLVARARA